MAGPGVGDGTGTDDSLSRHRLEAGVGYGLSAFGGGFTGTPEPGFGVSESGRDYRLGWRLTPAGGNTAGGNAGSFELHLEATRREAANGDGRPEYGVGVRMTVRW